MSYAPVREPPSPTDSPEPALEDPELDEDPDTDNIHQQHPPTLHNAHAASDRLPLDPAKFAPESEALHAEAELEAKHAEKVDEQLDDGAAAVDSTEPPSVLTDTSALETGAAVLPEPSPATLAAELENVMGKPSEMTAEELKEHMADVAERVAADVKEMEERKQQPARSRPDRHQPGPTRQTHSHSLRLHRTLQVHYQRRGAHDGVDTADCRRAVRRRLPRR